MKNKTFTRNAFTKVKSFLTIAALSIAVSFLFVGIVSYASTTISTNITTGGTLTVTGLTTLGNASTTQISASSNIYTALTANSIPYIGASGLLTQDNSNLVWDSTNNRMGIGTSSPYAKLSIHANNGETNTTLFNIASSTASATTSLFTVLNNGNVGVGTDAPDYTLDVAGNIGVDQYIFHNGDTNTYINFNSTDQIYFKVGDKTLLQLFEGDQDYVKLGDGSDIDVYMGPSSRYTFIQGSSGNMGIGTTSPATPIDVYTTATTTITLDSSSATNGGCLKIKNATTTGYIYCISNGGGLQCSTTSCE